ncbi:MAG: hypothetical protein HC930_16850 [Hydrococcus sp. SU_1_0]|nr:hypothetical protein [Hydrococcus sp. SU_1_0]
MPTKITNFLPISWTKTNLTATAIAIFSLSSIPAHATPLFKQINLAEKLLTQNNSQPPEVIIDDPNNSGTSGGNTPPSTSADTRFTCDFVNGEYTVMYNPENQSSSAYPWAIPSALGGGWTPEKRCNEITNRLESYRADGLQEMSTGVENGYDTVCVTTRVDPTDCRIVFTVPPGQDPQVTRDLVFENLLVADDGQATQGVYTYGEDGNSGNIVNDIGNVLGVGGSKPGNSPDKIDLRPFLHPTDGGTGARLNNSVAPNKPSNSPNNRQNERKPAIFQ